MKHNVFDQNTRDKAPAERPKEAHGPKHNCFAEFLVTAGLYEKAPITEDNFSELLDLIDGNVRISVYCPKCKEQRVFSMQRIEVPIPSGKFDGDLVMIPLAEKLRQGQRLQEMFRDPMPGESDKSVMPEWDWKEFDPDNEARLLTLQFICAMNPDHRLDYVVLTTAESMIKIGQYPSVADLSFSELDEFKKVIDDASRKELRRAIGLHAQGIGVGSYVYLRRIFERILDEAKTEAELAGTVDLSGYNNLKVVDRIRLLKDFLPAMINDNYVFYGIVSKGIHELSEDECISYFPVLEEAIFMILRQWAQKKQEQEAAKRLNASLSQIATQVIS